MSTVDAFPLSLDSRSVKELQTRHPIRSHNLWPLQAQPVMKRQRGDPAHKVSERTATSDMAHASRACR